ncbi:hypothetical protein BKA70DRAFT_1278680 [Coprinopsis sp. MPI-PUGE-AT-0042]|nr:hypothetical protein BKA70DRAFT_1278680 [Coprinopsis sp. MPI-PUGE-AT-0042]
MSLPELTIPARSGRSRRRSSVVAESPIDFFSALPAAVKKTHEFPDGPVNIPVWAADYLATVGAAMGSDQAKERLAYARMSGLHVSRVGLYTSLVASRHDATQSSATGSAPSTSTSRSLAAQGPTSSGDHRHYTLVAEVSTSVDARNTQQQTSTIDSHRPTGSQQQSAQVEGYLRIENTCRPAIFANDKSRFNNPSQNPIRQRQFDEEFSKVLMEKLTMDAPVADEPDSFISPFMTPNPSVAATRANSRSQPGSYHSTLNVIGEESLSWPVATAANPGKRGVHLVVSTLEEQEPAEFWAADRSGDSHFAISMLPPIKQGHASREGDCLLFLSNDRDKQTGHDNHLTLRDFIFLLDLLERHTGDPVHHSPTDGPLCCIGRSGDDGGNMAAPPAGCCCQFFQRFCTVLPMLSNLHVAQGALHGGDSTDAGIDLGSLKRDLQVCAQEFDETLSRVKDSRKPRKARQSSLETHGEVEEGSPPCVPKGLVA